MEGEETVVATYVFGGNEFVLSMASSEGSLEVEVEDKMTADQWRGSFDAACE